MCKSPPQPHWPQKHAMDNRAQASRETPEHFECGQTWPACKYSNCCLARRCCHALSGSSESSIRISGWQRNAYLVAMNSNQLAMASNLLAMPSNLRAMASNLLTMASNLLAFEEDSETNRRKLDGHCSSDKVWLKVDPEVHTTMVRLQGSGDNRDKMPSRTCKAL